LSGQQYTQGVGGLDVLSKLGAQQQAQEQAKIDYPLSLEERQAAILKGLQVPMSTEQKFKGPIPGAYQASPLQQILGYTAGTASLFTPDPRTGKSPLQQIPGLKDLFGGAATTPTTPGIVTPPADQVDNSGISYVGTDDQGNGFYRNANGDYVTADGQPWLGTVAGADDTSFGQSAPQYSDYGDI
jgi:hypothetical protein